MLKQCEKIDCQNWFEPTTYRGKETRFCSQSCANSRGPMLEKDKEFRRQFAKENPVGWASNPLKFRRASKSPKENRECLNPKCSNTFIVHLNWKQEAKRKYCSNQCNLEHNQTFGGYQPNSTIKHRSIYQGYQMDSGAELYFAKAMNKLGIKWIKNDISWNKFFYFTFNGKQGKYYPDFYLPQADIWVEIKGKRYIRDGDEERRNAVPGTILLLISNDFQKEFQSYLKQIKSHLK